MEKNVSSVAEQDKTAEVKKNPKLIELARPYKFDDKEYTEIDLSGLDDLTIKKLRLHTPTLWPLPQRSSPSSFSSCFPSAQARRFARLFRRRSVAPPQRKMATRTSTATS